MFLPLISLLSPHPIDQILQYNSNIPQSIYCDQKLSKNNKINKKREQNNNHISTIILPTMDPVYYDSLLVELFQTMDKYNTTIQDLQDHLYDCLYYNSEAERQAGLFSPQLNSSSYFGLSLTPHLYVVHPDDEQSDVNTEKRVAPKQLAIQSVLPQLEALEKAEKEKQENDAKESATTPDDQSKVKKTNSTPEDDSKSCINDPEADGEKKDAIFKRKAVVDKPEESSDEEDSGSDIDIDALLQDDTDDEQQHRQQKKKNNNKKAETQKQKVQNLQDLLRIFSVIPSPPLVQAQTEWISLIQDKLPQYYAAKRELEVVVEKIEAYKMQFKTKL